MTNQVLKTSNFGAAVIRTLHCVEEKLGDIEDLSGVWCRAVRLLRGQPVGQHDPAEWASRRNRVVAISARGREGTQRLIGTVLVDSGTDPLLHPHPRATSAAAERAFARSGHFGDRGARQRPEQITWRIVDLVMPAQIARVVVGDASSGNRAFRWRDRCQPT